MSLGDIYAVNPGLIKAYQLHVTPDSRIRKARPPVPSEHAMCLPQIRKSPHGIPASGNRVLLILLPDKFRGRTQHHLQLVSGFPQNSLHRKFPCAVHVIHIPDQGSVDPDIAERVDSVKAQQHLVTFQKPTIHIKARHILKIVLHHPKGFRLIVPVIGILHPPVGQQVIVNAARY